MVYKANIGDYPLLDYPCSYWWVRYATACTFLSEQQDKLWEPRLKQFQAKYHFEGFAYSGSWKRGSIDFGADDTRTVTVFRHLKIDTKLKQVAVTNKSSELWRFFEQMLEDDLGWGNCPYEQDHQSTCPFYIASEFYKSTPLDELRQAKGYEL